MFKQQQQPIKIDAPRAEPPVPFAPPARREVRGHAYAQAQHEWEQMENEVTILRSELGKANAQISVLEEANKLLHEDMAHLKIDNERLTRENVAIHTRVRICADTLVGLVKPVDPARPTEAEALGAAAVEGALLGDQLDMR